MCGCQWWLTSGIIIIRPETVVIVRTLSVGSLSDGPGIEFRCEENVLVVVLRVLFACLPNPYAHPRCPPYRTSSPSDIISALIEKNPSSMLHPWHCCMSFYRCVFCFCCHCRWWFHMMIGILFFHRPSYSFSFPRSQWATVAPIPRFQ